MPTSRRDVLATGARWLAGAALGASAGPARAASAKVVVVGGGYGGATAAKYVRKWSRGTIGVALVEREEALRLLPAVESRHRREP